MSAARQPPVTSSSHSADADNAARVPACFALLGNPNTGKTTLFNQLTGGNAKGGNYPGITVERQEGVRWDAC